MVYQQGADEHVVRHHVCIVGAAARARFRATLRVWGWHGRQLQVLYLYNTQVSGSLSFLQNLTQLQQLSLSPKGS